MHHNKFLITLVTLGMLCSYGFAADYAAYSLTKKEPVIGAALNLITPVLGLGHLYAGDWGRHVPFLLGETAGLLLMVGAYDSQTQTLTNSSQYGLGVLIFLVADLWGMVDVVSVIEKDNANLRSRFGISAREGDPVVEGEVAFW